MSSRDFVPGFNRIDMTEFISFIVEGPIAIYARYCKRGGVDSAHNLNQASARHCRPAASTSNEKGEAIMVSALDLGLYSIFLDE